MGGFELESFWALIDTNLVQAWLANSFSALLILCVGIFVSRRLGTFLRRSLGNMRHIDATLALLFASIVRYAILIITIIAVLGSLGIETTSIIAVLGAAGLAIGLALQGTLSNVAAGVMILFLQPFKGGDWIETGGLSGIVSEIGLFNTSITTFDNVLIAVPNSSIWGSTITNHSTNKTRRMDVDIGVAYHTDLDKAEATLLALAEDERVLKKPEPQFLIVSYDDSAITVRLRIHANADVFWQLYWDMLRRLKPALDAADIEIPFPQRDIHTIKPS